ncbi:hypothetical protein PG994_012512 [Apiospora phragmitis]|uniref:Aminoglycoside phosphotransferase domain-containing protein n=1 Tax=Apiospora phragmitis TaxID=2905665 RepID=A0ABR1TWA2_9PEZI
MSVQRPSSAQSNVSSRSSASSWSSTSSQSSTSSHDEDMYENQEDYEISFEEARPKILEICRTLWPDARHELTRRFVAQIPNRPEVVEEYVERLRFVSSKFPEIKHLVPSVFQVDATRDHPLGIPYMVRSHIPRKPRKDIYGEMSQEQRVHVGAELGETYRKILGMRFEYSGFLELALDDGDSDDSNDDGTLPSKVITIEPFGLIEKEYEAGLNWEEVRESINDDFGESDHILTSTNLLEDEPNMTARDILLLTFERRIQRDRHWESREFENDALEPALKIVREIVNKETNAGVFAASGCSTSLSNPEMNVPEYTMVDFDDAGKPMITGFLEWNATELVPHPLGCPVDPAGAEVKRALDEAAGPAFRAAAYNPDVVFARRYFAVAACQNWWFCDEHELEYLAAEWRKRNPSSSPVEGERRRRRRR